MKMTYHFKAHTFVLAALSMGLSFVSPAFAFTSLIVDSNGEGLINVGIPGRFQNIARGINDTGQVVGHFTAPAGDRAFITGSNGAGMTDLGTLGGVFSDAYGINDTGQVTGTSTTTAGEEHAFITGPNGVGMTDLGTLGGGQSVAHGINNTGQVVGSSYTTGGETHAFITGPNGVGMTDLNSLVALPDGSILINATGINNLGQIIAISNAIPEPATYALMLAGLGLVGFMARRTKSHRLSG
jgi:probable HAF family extracellular repeat protein